MNAFPNLVINDLRNAALDADHLLGIFTSVVVALAVHVLFLNSVEDIHTAVFFVS